MTPEADLSRIHAATEGLIRTGEEYVRGLEATR